jgi:hypothetical protein
MLLTYYVFPGVLAESTLPNREIGEKPFVFQK